MWSSDEEIPRLEQSAKYSIEFYNPTGKKKQIIFQKIIIEKKNSETLYELTSSGKKMHEHKKYQEERKCRSVRKNLYKDTSSESSNFNFENSQKFAMKNKSKLLHTSSDKLNVDSISRLLNESESDDSDNESSGSLYNEEIDVPRNIGGTNCDIVMYSRKNLNLKSTNMERDENVIGKGKNKDENGCKYLTECLKNTEDNCDDLCKRKSVTPSKKKRYNRESSRIPLKGNRKELLNEEIQPSKSFGLDSPCAVSTKDKKNSSTPRNSIQCLKTSLTPSVRLIRNDHNSCEDLAKNTKKRKDNDDKLNKCDYSTPSKRRRYDREASTTPSQGRNGEETVDEGAQPPKLLHQQASANYHETHGTPDRKTYSIQSLKRITTPSTPSTRKGTPKRLHLTPSMPVCKRNEGTPRTPLQDAMTRLHVSAVPGSLPCREDEFRNIFNFLEGKLLDGAGGCMYISGVPGTGKTATVRAVVNLLHRMVEDGDLSDFQFIEINGMRLSHPRQAYVQLWKSLSGELLTPEQAQRLLENKFTRNSKKNLRSSVVLLVDEVDVLWTKRQDVVYNLLDWPTKTKSRLVVVTIANTMDLPERLLMGRVTSRLGLTRLTFQPYTHKQLEEIVKARLEGIHAFDADAIQFVSRKVASVTGDARRALDICRRATEIAELESPQNLVTIKHVDDAMSTMTSSCTVQAIMQACSTMEQMFLQAVEAELARTGLEETTFRKAYSMLETLCSLEGITLPSTSKAMGVCMRLTSLRLLLSQHSHMDVYSRIFLNISVDDLHYALQEVRREKNNKK